MTEWNLVNLIREIRDAGHKGSGQENEVGPSETPNRKDSDAAKKNVNIGGGDAAVTDVGIVTALQTPEFEQLLAVFPELQKLEANLSSFNYWLGEIEANSGRVVRIAACHQSEMGMTAASYQTASMIHRFDPSFLFMTGICAGVDGQSKLGDLIVPSVVFDYGSGKISSGKFKPDYRQVDFAPTDISLVETELRQPGKAKSLCSKFEGLRPALASVTVHTGPMATGAAVVADSSIVDRIQEANRKLVGLEMEAYGFAKTVKALSPNSRALVLKGVCDLADESKNDDYQDFSAYLSAAYCRSFIEAVF